MSKELRPCVIRRRLRGSEEIKKGLFHTWFQESDIVAPSIMVGGHNGGCVSTILGLIELEDGTMRTVDPKNITFLDAGTVFKGHPIFESLGDFLEDKEK